PLGKYSDRHFMSESKINDTMETIQHGNPHRYWIYTDKGFNRDSLIRCAAHGPGYISPQQHEDNRLMAKVRITEEWCFGKA
ncbi:transposase family protein, partial [Acinetobacter baumannii]